MTDVVEALRRCAETFRSYEQLHLAKGTDDGRAKAATNAAMAEMCEAAIAAHETARAEKAWLVDLTQTATMLETYAPDIFPDVNEYGQVHFGRMMMEVAAQCIRAALTAQAAEIARAITTLAHTDISSLPNDWTLQQIAEARIDDLLKLRDQVRDTCTRAEKAERQLATVTAERDRLIDALRMYARPDHWMALTSEADSPNVVWIARTHLDATPDGYSTAFQVLVGQHALSPASAPEPVCPDCEGTGQISYREAVRELGDMSGAYHWVRKIATCPNPIHKREG